MQLESIQIGYLERAMKDGTVIEEVTGMVTASYDVGHASGKAYADTLNRAKVRMLIRQFRQFATEICPDFNPDNDVTDEVEMEAATWHAAASHLADAYQIKEA